MNDCCCRVPATKSASGRASTAMPRSMPRIVSMAAGPRFAGGTDSLHHQGHEARGDLRLRPVERGARRLVDRLHAHVPDDADHRGLEHRPPLHADALAEGALARPELARRGLIDHHHRRAIRSVLDADVAALEDRHPEGAEHARGDEADVAARLVSRRGRGLADDLEARRRPDGEGQPAHAAGGGHAGDGGQRVHRLLEEARLTRGLGVARVGQRDVEAQHRARIESGIGPGQPHEAAEQQSPAGHEHQRDRHLSGDEQAAQAAAARPHSSRRGAFLERRAGAGSSRAAGRAALR